MSYILFEDHSAVSLLPLTALKPVYYLRIGIDTIIEKWHRYFGESLFTTCRSYLFQKYGRLAATPSILVNGKFIPTRKLIYHIKQLKPNQVLIYQDEIVAANVPTDFFHQDLQQTLPKGMFYSFQKIEYTEEHLIYIHYPWDIFTHNHKVILQDFNDLVPRDYIPIPVDPYTRMYEPENIYVERGAKIYAAVLNATEGPIYIGKNAEIMEGTVIRGPFVLGEGSVLKMGAKMYGDTTIGPYCKIGGEVANSVFMSYSNKAHDGYVGNSVIGSWCNLGADTNTSNLKNNYSKINAWNYEKQGVIATNLQFCGLIMGDHSKSGINTMFNTGTVVGVGCNIFDAAFPPKYIPDFSWGSAAFFQRYDIEKLLDTAKAMYQRRGLTLKEDEITILRYWYAMTK
ncbi:MAG: GlmU family protein [Bacteroidia bacterium]|nr:GlmU family protein [Bacteroidia bacterium]MDW8346851.1 GlmU family protein [Bacteroidia bacterium]